jgi:hypothetical protein
MTSLVGAVFALGYLSSGSLWPCAVGHFLYDFFLFDTMRLSQGHDASAWSVLPILGAVSLGILSWFRILNGHKVQVEFVRDDDY